MKTRHTKLRLTQRLTLFLTRFEEEVFGKKDEEEEVMYGEEGVEQF